MYKNVVGEMTVLKPHIWVHEYLQFGENVKVYVRPFISAIKKFILVLLNTSQVVEEVFLINSTSCLWQLTLYHQAMPTVSEVLEH